MNEEGCPTLITIGSDTFQVSPGFLETLDEIGFAIRTNSRAEVLQQAVALLYLLSRERQEHRVQTFMHYPDGGMRMLQFWKTAGTPKLHAVGAPAPQENTQEAPSAFAHYLTPTVAFQEHQAQAQQKHLTIDAHLLALRPANDPNFF